MGRGRPVRIALAGVAPIQCQLRRSRRRPCHFAGRGGNGASGARFTELCRWMPEVFGTS